jgi:uncharacterized protein
MRSGLPAIIDPIQLAERGAHLIGTLPLSRMARLRQMCLDDEAEVAVDLRFGRPEGERRAQMAGELRVTLHVTCQRCLDRMDLTLTVTPQLVFRRPDEPEEPALAEDVVVVDKPLSLSAMVEDELLLAMPMFPKHDPAVCRMRTL